MEDSSLPTSTRDGWPVTKRRPVAREKRGRFRAIAMGLPQMIAGRCQSLSRVFVLPVVFAETQFRSGRGNGVDGTPLEPSRGIGRVS